MSDGPVMLSPTEQRIMNLLSDGLPHTKKEIASCLTYQKNCEDNIKPHLHHLRKKIGIKGEAILCVLVDRRIRYRWVALKGPLLTLRVTDRGLNPIG